MLITNLGVIMQTNLHNTLVNTFLLHVNTKPLQTPVSWQEKDADDNPIGEKRTWTEETLRGVLLTNVLNPKKPTEIEIGIRTTQMHSLFEQPTPNYGDILEAYFENKADFISGKKLLKATVMQMPRVNRTGDKANVATSFTPVLTGFEVVDAGKDDLEYIEHMASLDNEEGQEVELPHSDVA